MLLDQFDYHVCYYRLQFACQACWWGLVYLLSGGRWVYELGDASVATSPAWLVGPPQHSVGNLMVWLHARRRTVYLAMPYMLGVAALATTRATSSRATSPRSPCPSITRPRRR